MRMANTTQLKFYYSKHTQDNAVAVKKSGAKVAKCPFASAPSQAPLPSATDPCHALSRQVGKHSFVRVDCYVWTSDGNGTRVPLELYFNKERADHLATATAGGRVYALEHNYTLLGVQVRPRVRCALAAAVLPLALAGRAAPARAPLPSCSYLCPDRARSRVPPPDPHCPTRGLSCPRRRTLASVCPRIPHPC